MNNGYYLVARLQGEQKNSPLRETWKSQWSQVPDFKAGRQSILNSVPGRASMCQSLVLARTIQGPGSGRLTLAGDLLKSDVMACWPSGRTGQLFAGFGATCRASSHPCCGLNGRTSSGGLIAAPQILMLQ